MQESAGISPEHQRSEENIIQETENIKRSIQEIEITIKNKISNLKARRKLAEILFPMLNKFNLENLSAREIHYLIIYLMSQKIKIFDETDEIIDDASLIDMDPIKKLPNPNMIVKFPENQNQNIYSEIAIVPKDLDLVIIYTTCYKKGKKYWVTTYVIRPNYF
jgi:hypothetical protein